MVNWWDFWGYLNGNLQIWRFFGLFRGMKSTEVSHSWSTKRKLAAQKIGLYLMCLAFFLRGQGSSTYISYTVSAISVFGVLKICVSLSLQNPHWKQECNNSVKQQIVMTVNLPINTCIWPHWLSTLTFFRGTLRVKKECQENNKVQKFHQCKWMGPRIRPFG